MKTKIIIKLNLKNIFLFDHTIYSLNFSRNQFYIEIS